MGNRFVGGLAMNKFAVQTFYNFNRVTNIPMHDAQCRKEPYKMPASSSIRRQLGGALLSKAESCPCVESSEPSSMP